MSRQTYGPLAQLGERKVRNLEARGSIPLGSTTNEKDTPCGCPFRLRSQTLGGSNPKGRKGPVDLSGPSTPEASAGRRICRRQRREIP